MVYESYRFYKAEDELVPDPIALILREKKKNTI